jgi:hypothetical protein
MNFQNTDVTNLFNCCNSVTASPVKHRCTLVCNNQSRMIFLYEIKYFYVLQVPCLSASVTNSGNVVANGSQNILLQYSI